MLSAEFYSRHPDTVTLSLPGDWDPQGHCVRSLDGSFQTCILNVPGYINTQRNAQARNWVFSGDKTTSVWETGKRSRTRKEKKERSRRTHR